MIYFSLYFIILSESWSQISLISYLILCIIFLFFYLHNFYNSVNYFTLVLFNYNFTWTKNLSVTGWLVLDVPLIFILLLGFLLLFEGHVRYVFAHHRGLYCYCFANSSYILKDDKFLRFFQLHFTLTPVDFKCDGFVLLSGEMKRELKESTSSPWEKHITCCLRNVEISVRVIALGK